MHVHGCLWPLVYLCSTLCVNVLVWKQEQECMHKYSFSNITFRLGAGTCRDSCTKGRLTFTKSLSIPLIWKMLQSLSFILTSTHHLFDFSECASPESASTSPLVSPWKNFDHKKRKHFYKYQNPLEETTRKWLHFLSPPQLEGKPKLCVLQHRLVVFLGLKQSLH